MGRKCGGGEGQRSAGFLMAQRVGLIARSAQMQDFSPMVEYFFCSFVRCCCILYCVPSLFSNWTTIYLRHAMCQCNGDTSGDEDKHGPRCVAACGWTWHTHVDNKLYKVLGLWCSEVQLCELCELANKMYFSPYFTSGNFYRIFLLENVCPFLWARISIPSRIYPSEFNLMQVFYHIFC